MPGETHSTVRTHLYMTTILTNERFVRSSSVEIDEYFSSLIDRISERFHAFYGEDTSFEGSTISIDPSQNFRQILL